MKKKIALVSVSILCICLTVYMIIYLNESPKDKIYRYCNWKIPDCATVENYERVDNKVYAMLNVSYDEINKFESEISDRFFKNTERKGSIFTMAKTETSLDWWNLEDYSKIKYSFSTNEMEYRYPSFGCVYENTVMGYAMGHLFFVENGESYKIYYIEDVTI